MFFKTFSNRTLLSIGCQTLENNLTKSARFVRFFHYTKCIKETSITNKKAEDFKTMVSTWEARTLFQSVTHSCGELSEKDIDKEIIICGWVTSVRKLSNKLQFLTLRDHSGFIQCIIREDSGAQVLSAVNVCVPETVVSIRGAVQNKQDSQTSRDNSATETEIMVQQLHILSTPQGQIAYAPSNTWDLPREEVRLQTRYLDLRRSELQNNLKVRSDCARIVRETLNKENFQEIETPLLFKPTPEGAREFLVPTRSGLFYALPQSPQQYKQLLMASGVNKYFQIAKCFRDEDHRSDRQPEFTQIDLEMAYATPSKVMNTAENLVKKLWRSIKSIDLTEPFPVMSYQLAMEQYGSDKPDLRGGHIIIDVTDCLNQNIPQLSKQLFGLRIQAISLPPTSNTPSFNHLKKWIKEKNLNCRLVRASNPIFPPPFSANDEEHTLWQNGLAKATEFLSVEKDDLIAFEITKGPFYGAWTSLGRLRLFWLEHFSLDPEFKFLWVTQFPLLAPISNSLTESNSNPDHPVDYTAYAPVHHPFTSPVPEDFSLLFSQPDKVRAEHYDLVLNGIEIGGGSIRIHDPDLQLFMFKEVMKMTPEGMDRFTHLLEALRSGCPPHGGLALGFDRLVALLCGTTNLRNVIAFPKSSSGSDLTVGSPAAI